MMKKLIDRFRKWLIVKLGGYTTYFVTNTTVNTTRMRPIKVVATFEMDRELHDVIEETEVRSILAKRLVEEVEKNNLFEISQCRDHRLCRTFYKMSILVVDPKECAE